MSRKTYQDPLRDRPCWTCPENGTCNKMCKSWETWFIGAWRELRQIFGFAREEEANA